VAISEYVSRRVSRGLTPRRRDIFSDLIGKLDRSASSARNAGARDGTGSPIC
jgi:hypothetical protein